MTALSNRIESRMERLSLPLALEWPGGRAEKAGAQVRLKLHKPSLLNWLALGRIGNLGDAYVRGDLDIEGRLGDVMTIAAELAGDPVQQGHPSIWTRLILRARSAWLHTSTTGVPDSANRSA